MPHRTNITCHRGARLLAPENTFPAFDAALACGGDVLEFDVRQSKDGVLYVIHDETVDRTTDGTGLVSQFTAAELDAFDAGRWYGAPWTGTRLPRLEDFLIRYAKHAGFYLEVKLADCEAIGHLIRKYECAAQTYTCSFDTQMRADMLKYAPDVRQMLHCWNVEDPREAMEIQGAGIIEFHLEHLDDDHIENARKAGLDLQFYSADWLPDTIAQMMRLGFDYVNIDHIPEAAALRRALQT